MPAPLPPIDNWTPSTYQPVGMEVQMTRSMRMPAWLHDVFGEEQRGFDLLAIIAFGLGVPMVAVALAPATFAALPFWRSGLALLLIADIAAGCIANLTAGTNDFYATRPRNRLIFLAVHVHILVVAFLLDLDLAMAAAIWAYTIIGGVLVNARRKGSGQRVLAGLLFALGASAVVYFGSGSPLLASIGLLFVLKVMVNFAVDHRAEARS